MFFFEKKNQKTFAFWARVADRSATANKSFLLLFFKKEVLHTVDAGHRGAAALSVITSGTFNRMSFKSCLLLGAACACLPLLALPLPARAAPPVVGSGNEAVIDPPVPHPDETPCTVTLTSKAKFGANSVTPRLPPAQAPGPKWFSNSRSR
jgi:hypothetical protein